MELKTALGAIVIAVILFFAIIFALASVYALTRLYVAVFLFVVAFVIGFYVTRKPKTIIQKLEVSGEMKTVTIKCPNCSGSVDPNTIKMVDGVPYATCPYCGHNFEVTEEPKW
jgi:Zn finger protein HypA/HybF involved in hydrogenase expression